LTDISTGETIVSGLLLNGDTCRIVELRRYALRPGMRETLIELFDTELVEPQEEAGMHILGEFRDVDDPDSFVWLRGFGDMESRKRALEAFYGGPVWRTHAAAANATMLDVDNVLLLRPLTSLELDTSGRPPRGTAAGLPGVLAITIHPLRATADGFAEVFDQVVEPALRKAGIPVLAIYVTEPSKNTYPALPVREGEDVFVWMVYWKHEGDRARHAAALDPLRPTLAEHGDGPATLLRLTPTGRSLLHG
jgi:quinol monooxygenase YgiN